MVSRMIIRRSEKIFPYWAGHTELIQQMIIRLTIYTMRASLTAIAQNIRDYTKHFSDVERKISQALQETMQLPLPPGTRDADHISSNQERWTGFIEHLRDLFIRLGDEYNTKLVPQQYKAEFKAVE